MKKKNRGKIKFDELDRISEANGGKLYGGNSSSSPQGNYPVEIEISITYTF